MVHLDDVSSLMIYWLEMINIQLYRNGFISLDRSKAAAELFKQSSSSVELFSKANDGNQNNFE